MKLAEGDRTLPQQASLRAPAGVTFLPTERVLLLAVAMAGMSAAQRRAAVGFAVEGMIAQPLDAVQVVLGPALKNPGTWLVAVIGTEVLATLPLRAKTRLLPDVLALPVPEDGQWSVWENAGRILVRTPDGTGFAADAASLPYYHLAAGRPGVMLYGGALDAQFTIIAQAAFPPAMDLGLQRFDLAQSPLAGIGMWRKWQPLGAVAAFAAIAHLGLVAADVWALNRISDGLNADIRATLVQMGQPAEGDLDAVVARVLGQANGRDAPEFITLATGVFTTIANETGRVTASELRYAGDVRSLTLQLQAPDIATLQAVEGSLKSAGFAVTVGPATTGDGLAEQALTLTGGGI